MKHPTNRTDDHDPHALSVAQALERIHRDIRPIAEHESVALSDGLGRSVAQDVFSPINVPPHANSAMDGYALHHRDLPAGSTTTTLHVIGTAWAGKPYSGRVQAGQCVRIMTGALLPEGTDTVIMQERVEHVSDNILRIGAGNTAGQHVRQAGEDIGAGQCVLSRGTLLRPAELGVAASLGITHLPVTRRLRVAFFTTGDELRSVGEPLAAGEIYDSNRYTLQGMLQRLGVEIIDLGIVRDTRAELETAFVEAARVADAIVTCGGVSVGEADFVKETLEKLGQVNFWKIAMKPGRPLAFGRVNNAWFFGLPGNPVSVMVTFYQFAQPALRRLMGQRLTDAPRIKLPTATRLHKAPGRTEFQRGVTEINAQGQTVVRVTGEQGSGMLSSMSKANCFIVLPAESSGAEAGDWVDVQLFEGLV